MGLRLCMLSQLSDPGRGNLNGVQLSCNTQNSAQSPCEVGDQGQALLKNHRMREGRKYNFQLLLEAKIYCKLHTWGGRGY